MLHMLRFLSAYDPAYSRVTDSQPFVLFSRVVRLPTEHLITAACGREGRGTGRPGQRGISCCRETG